MRAFILPLLTLLPIGIALAACSSAEELAQAANSGAPGSEDQATAASATAKVSSRSGVSVKEETDHFSFGYDYPAVAASIPELAAELDRRTRSAKDELISVAEADRKAAANAGFPYRAHSFSEEWKVVTDLPGWLSLTGEFATYSGGAHGNYGVTSLVWNKQAGRAYQGIDLFTSPAALDRAKNETYCARLNAQREKKNGIPVNPDTGDIFSACPNVTALTVIPGSSDGKAFDRIGFYAGPYVAGSYAEGSYEVTLLVDARILSAVKPEFRSSFKAAP